MYIPSAGTVAGVKLRLIVLFSEVRVLCVTGFSVRDGFVGVRVHGATNLTPTGVALLKEEEEEDEDDEMLSPRRLFLDRNLPKSLLSYSGGAIRCKEKGYCGPQTIEVAPSQLLFLGHGQW